MLHTKKCINQAREMQEEVRSLREDLADLQELKQRLLYAQVCTVNVLRGVASRACVSFISL